MAALAHDDRPGSAIPGEGVLLPPTSFWRPARPFIVNDPEYKPFGLVLLRGVTPARLALVIVLVASYRFWRMGGFLFEAGRTLQFLYSLSGGTALLLTGALPMLLVAVHALRETSRWSGIRRIGALALAVVSAAILFAGIVYGLANVLSWSSGTFTLRPAVRTGVLLNLLYQASLLGGLCMAVAYLHMRTREAEVRRYEVERARSAIEREIAEARLRMLQAQIEPHFLFNSLASVKRLYETDATQGRAMIESLRRYLREAIPRGRKREASLEGEVALATAFLEVLEIRMGSRLKVRVQVDPALRSRRVPPLMLVTLVENAVKHGIGPRGSGGTIEIGADSLDGVLKISVSDDGVGFREHTGPGIGLANTRARLRTLYGGDAGLDVSRNAAGGVVATIRIPEGLATPSAEGA